MLKTSSLVLALAIAIAGVAYADQQQPTRVPSMGDVDGGFADYWVVHYVAKIERSVTGWKLISAHQTSDSLLFVSGVTGNQEVLEFIKTFRYVQPAWRQWIIASSGPDAPQTNSFMRASANVAYICDSRATTAYYSPCRSSFVDPPERLRVLRKDKVVAAVREIGGSTAVLEAVKRGQDSDYHYRFREARTSAEIEAYIAAYEKNDPEGLVEEAQRHLTAVRAQEREAQLRQQKESAAREAKRRKDVEALRTKLAAWRKSLKIGSDTFCGPVIELRLPMVKIAVTAQLQGFAAETWLKIDELYPDWMASCFNTNGRVSPQFAGTAFDTR